MAEMLSRLGYEYKIVENGAEAVEAFRSEPFDVVLMDLHMPSMDGFEAARHIRGLSRELRPVRLIAVTADTRDPRTREGGDCFDAVLVKPVSQSDLLDILGADTPPASMTKLSPDGGILDYAYGLRAAGGVLGQFLVLVKLFLKHTPDLMSLLDRSVRLKAYEEIALHAHSLQGSAASIGGLRLSSAADELTLAARSREGWPQVEALRDTVDAQWLELRKLLNEVDPAV